MKQFFPPLIHSDSEANEEHKNRDGTNAQRDNGGSGGSPETRVSKGHVTLRWKIFGKSFGKSLFRHAKINKIAFILEI